MITPERLAEGVAQTRKNAEAKLNEYIQDASQGIDYRRMTEAIWQAVRKLGDDGIFCAATLLTAAVFRLAEVQKEHVAQKDA